MSAAIVDKLPLQGALRSLGIIIKTVRLYPAGHPARLRAIVQGIEHFMTALTGQDLLLLEVRRDHFEQQGQPIAGDNPALKDLARHLFMRKVQTLAVLPELSEEELEEFADCLAIDADEISRRGGFDKVLSQSRIANIWINETDLSHILSLREDMKARQDPERNKDATESPAAENPDEGDQVEQSIVLDRLNDEPEAQTPEKLLARMKQEFNDDTYRLLVRRLMDAISLLDHHLEFARLCKILLALGDNCRNPRLSEVRRDACRHALGILLEDPLLQQLSTLMCQPATTRDNMKRLQHLFMLTGERAADILAHRLAEEVEAHARKILAQTLVRMESAALPAMHRLLNDTRWYVIRNALVVIGEIRDPSRVAQLAGFLGHDDVRVRREAVRTLARIGTPEAVEVLLSTMEKRKSDSDLQMQALLFLGALKQRAALPHLLRFVSTADPLLRRAALTRGAVKALGEIGAEEAVAPLAALMNRRKLLYKRRFQEIQEAAALALARIGTPEARSALSIAARQGTGRLAQTATRALSEAPRDPS